MSQGFGDANDGEPSKNSWSFIAIFGGLQDTYLKILLDLYSRFTSIVSI